MRKVIPRDLRRIEAECVGIHLRDGPSLVALKTTAMGPMDTPSASSSSSIRVSHFGFFRL